MAATALTVENAKSANIDVIEDARGGSAVHEMVIALRANRRSGTAHTKTRGEVAGSNAKPWRQKGTGRARAGRVTSPIWRGGGTVFGPRNRDYSKKVTKSARRLAFRKAISERIKAGDVFTAASFAVSDGKTKSFVKELAGLVSADVKRVLILGTDFDEKTYLAGRNVQTALLMTADEVNVEQILYYDAIVVIGNAIETIARRSAPKPKYQITVKERREPEAKAEPAPKKKAAVKKKAAAKKKKAAAPVEPETEAEAAPAADDDAADA